MEQVGEHPVPVGPLAVRWLAYELPPQPAGAATKARILLENAGSAAWRPEPGRRIELAYHWLDERGNALVWDGIWTHFGRRAVEPGDRLEVEADLRAPMPPGRYRLAWDIVEEGRFWLSELGNTMLELDVEVAPRIGRALAVRGADPDALAGQEERVVPEEEAEAVAWLAPGCVPAPDWSRRLLDAHQEGYAAVGGSVEPLGGPLARRRAQRALGPWAAGTGRNPAFAHPLLCPSLVCGLGPDWADPVEGLPALRPSPDEPWVYDGRVVVRARLRSGRRPG